MNENTCTLFSVENDASPYYCLSLMDEYPTLSVCPLHGKVALDVVDNPNSPMFGMKLHKVVYQTKQLTFTGRQFFACSQYLPNGDACEFLRWVPQETSNKAQPDVRDTMSKAHPPATEDFPPPSPENTPPQEQHVKALTRQDSMKSPTTIYKEQLETLQNMGFNGQDTQTGVPSHRVLCKIVLMSFSISRGKGKSRRGNRQTSRCIFTSAQS